MLSFKVTQHYQDHIVLCRDTIFLASTPTCQENAWVLSRRRPNRKCSFVSGRSSFVTAVPTIQLFLKQDNHSFNSSWYLVVSWHYPVTESRIRPCVFCFQCVFCETENSQWEAQMGRCNSSVLFYCVIQTKENIFPPLWQLLFVWRTNAFNLVLILLYGILFP